MVTFGSSKKAQAAMEFLMTYGWAILVVLVVIGALAYFGVLSPATLLPEKCTFPVSISCSDFSVAPASITLILQNGAGRDMVISSINASSDALGGAGGALGCNCTTPAGSTTVRNGASATFTLNRAAAVSCAGGDPVSCGFHDTGRDKNRYQVLVSYSWLDSPTLTHIAPGELLARRP